MDEYTKLNNKIDYLMNKINNMGYLLEKKREEKQRFMEYDRM